MSSLNFDTPWCHPSKPKLIIANIKEQKTSKEVSEVVSFVSNLPLHFYSLALVHATSYIAML